MHARKAVLEGLSPEANRRIPPLRYDMVYQLARDFPTLRISINGGVETLEDVERHLAHGVHGVMVGRAVINRPWLWSQVDSLVFGEASDPAASRRQVLATYSAYADDQLARSERESPRYAPSLRRNLIRHTANLFAGERNGKRYRVELDAAMADPRLAPSAAIARATEVIDDQVLDLAPGQRVEDSVARQGADERQAGAMSA